MIPTILVVGLVLGRWPRTAIAVSSLGWAVVLLRGPNRDVITAGDVALGMVLAVLNAGVGVAVHQGILAIVHAVGGRSPELP